MFSFRMLDTGHVYTREPPLTQDMALDSQMKQLALHQSAVTFRMMETLNGRHSFHAGRRGNYCAPLWGDERCNLAQITLKNFPSPGWAKRDRRNSRSSPVWIQNGLWGIDWQIKLKGLKLGVGSWKVEVEKEPFSSAPYGVIRRDMKADFPFQTAAAVLFWARPMQAHIRHIDQQYEGDAHFYSKDKN